MVSDLCDVDAVDQDDVTKTKAIIDELIIAAENFE
jgi:hypothetical protein